MYSSGMTAIAGKSFRRLPQIDEASGKKQSSTWHRTFTPFHARNSPESGRNHGNTKQKDPRKQKLFRDTRSKRHEITIAR